MGLVAMGSFKGNKGKYYSERELEAIRKENEGFSFLFVAVLGIIILIILAVSIILKYF